MLALQTNSLGIVSVINEMQKGLMDLFSFLFRVEPVGSTLIVYGTAGS